MSQPPDTSDCRGFNLVDEPWILVLAKDGLPDELSLLDVFRRADMTRQLGGDISTQSFALLRLLLAILHRALADTAPRSETAVPVKVAQVRDHWDDQTVPAVESYLDRHRDRFDLFHPEHPFLQVAGMHAADGGVSSLSKLIVDVPAGMPYLTMRSGSALDRIAAGEAARWLVHAHAFDTSGIKTGVIGHPRAKNGKAYPERVGWCGQLGGVHLRGDSLRDTLWLNLWAALPNSNDDDPAWERAPGDVGVGPDLLHRPAGPVDLYTWQSRRIRLVGNRSGVTGVVLTYGDQVIPQERQALLQLEPMTGWRHSAPQTKAYSADIFMPRLHRPGVQMWRGLAGLLPQTDRSTPDTRPPRVVEHAVALVDEGVLHEDQAIRLRAVGVVYGAQNSVVDDIVDDDLDLPAALLPAAGGELRRSAVDAVEAADRAVFALASLAANLALAAGADREALDGPRDRIREAAYATLDPHYRRWLVEVLPAEDGDTLSAEREWQLLVRSQVSTLAEDLVRQSAPAAWVGRSDGRRHVDVGLAEAWFRSALAKALPRAKPQSPEEHDQTISSTTGQEAL